MLHRNWELERQILLAPRPIRQRRRPSLPGTSDERRIADNVQPEPQSAQPICRRRASEIVARPTFTDFLAGLQRATENQASAREDSTRRPSSFISRGRRPSIENSTAATIVQSSMCIFSITCFFWVQ